MAFKSLVLPRCFLFCYSTDYGSIVTHPPVWIKIQNAHDKQQTCRETLTGSFFSHPNRYLLKTPLWEVTITYPVAWWLSVVVITFLLTSKTAFGRGLFAAVQQYAWFSLLVFPLLWVFFFLFSWNRLTKPEKEQVRWSSHRPRGFSIQSILACHRPVEHFKILQPVTMLKPL